MRPATFAAAGWYDADPAVLAHKIRQWLQGTPNFGVAVTGRPPPDVPVDRFVGLIGPHAGLRFAGATAGTAYRVMHRYLVPERSTGSDVASDRTAADRSAAVRRIVLMGPSHRLPLDGVALSSASAYATPVAELTVDRASLDQLAAALRRRSVPIVTLSSDQEAAEHSLELHTPFIAHILNDRKEALPNASPIAIAPMLIGHMDAQQRAAVGDAVREVFLTQPQASTSHSPPRETLFVVSSDFCHWGARFRYQHLFERRLGAAGASPQASRFGVPDDEEARRRLLPGECIELMDHDAMAAIAAGDVAAWDRHLKSTGNTICGRMPIGVALATLFPAASSAACERIRPCVQWQHYDQSSLVRDIDRDSSVSYAAGVMLV